MKSLFESIIDTDDDIKSMAEKDSERVSIKKALEEFLSCLGIEANKYNGNSFPLIVNNRLPKYKPGWKCIVKYYMRYILQAYIDKYGHNWYYDKNYDEMRAKCRNIIKDALKDGFEKYLNKKHIQYEKFGSQPLTKQKYDNTIDVDITYSFDDYDVWFKLWRMDSKNVQRIYNKDPKYKEDYLNYQWNFEIVLPQDIWDAC